MVAVDKNNKILVMDDESTIRQLLSDALGYLGFSVTAVCCGEDAVAAYQQMVDSGQQYLVVIMDLTIKVGMNGVETAKILNEKFPEALIVAASGDDKCPEMVRPLEFGFQRAITKPFKIKELWDYLHRLQ